MNNGQRLETATGTPGLKVSEFEEFSSRVNSNELGVQDKTPAKALSTWSLVLDPTAPNRGELAWRLGLALAAVNFVVMAIAVSSVNPRAGRSGNLVFALFAFVVYYNLLNMGQSWISGGRASFFGYMAVLHGGAFLAGVLWLAKQHNSWSVPLLRRRRVARQEPAA